jgi:lipoprotein-releasing system permease protein
MYKLLLCWRYLKTRYLAMACIISVMLGVATLIVVNSVMSGFSTKLRERLHGLLSDVVIEAHYMEGFGDPQGKMDRIRRHPFLGPRVEAMAATAEVFGLLRFELSNGEPLTRMVKIIGIDPQQRALVGSFKEYLVNPDNKVKPTFDMPEDARKRFEFYAERELDDIQRIRLPVNPDEPPPPMPTPSEIKIPEAVILGNLLASTRVKNKDTQEFEDRYYIRKGDTVVLTTVGGQKLTPVYDRFVVVDYFKSEMSDYDANIVFVPLKYLQHLRTMEDRVTSIQIKLKDYEKDGDQVRDSLRAMFLGEPMNIETWEGKQGALLSAISIEKGILNVLLFLIIAVAGFGILAIFSMIVTEKTRDIGIIKALGASNLGVMNIFLSYGLLLGVVGAGLGSLLGILLTLNINEVESWLTQLTGKKIFDGSVYYFTEIPTDIQVSTVVMVNLGAILIAVLFSVLPAMRAAMLHPVRALRYE